MIKPQPTHSAEVLARIQRVPPGAQSAAGQRVLAHGAEALGRALFEPRRALRPDFLARGGGRRRWGA